MATISIPGNRIKHSQWLPAILLVISLAVLASCGSPAPAAPTSAPATQAVPTKQAAPGAQTAPTAQTAPAATAAASPQAVATKPAVKPEGEFVFAAAGGAIGETYKKILGDWTQKLGMKLTYVEGTSASNFAKVQAQARAGKPEIDVQNNNDQTLALGRGQGLWEKFNLDLMPNVKDLATDFAFPKDVVGDPPSGVRLFVIPIGIAYNTDIFKKNNWAPPSSWEDLYNPQYASCVIPLSPKSGVPYIQMLNKINAGDYAKIDTTLANFKKISKQVQVFSDSNPQAIEMLAQGAGCLTASQDARAYEQAEKGAPIGFVFPKEGAPFLGGTLAIVKGAPHPIAAQLAVNELLSAEAGQLLLEKAYYATPNLNVKKPSTGLASRLTVASQFKSAGLIQIPLSAFDKTDDWIKQWSEMAAR